MKQLIQVIREMDDFSAEAQEKTVMDWIQRNQLHTGNIMNAVRLAIVGEGKGPHMFLITEVIGREETIARLQRATDLIPVPENV